MKYLHYIHIALIILFANSCTSSKQASSVKKYDELSEHEKIALSRMFVDANKERILGNYDKSLRLYFDCIHIFPEHHPSYFEIAKLYSLTKNYDEALNFEKKCLILSPQNMWYKLLYADILEKQYKFKEAAKVYAELVKEYPDKVGYYLDWAAMLINSSEYTDAIEVYELVEKKIGVTEDISLQKQRIWLSMNKLDKAVYEIEKLLELHPEEIRYYGMIAELYQANDKKENALKIYKKMKAMDENDPHTRIALAEHYKSIGKYDSSFFELKHAFVNLDLSIDVKVKILLPYYMLIDKDSLLRKNAFELSKILVETYPLEAKAHAVYGDLLFNDSQYIASRAQYRSAIGLDPEKFPIWQQVLYINVELNDFESLLKESEIAIDYFPNHAMLFYFNGVAKIQLNQYHEAIIALKQGVNLTIDNSLLLSQFYASLGDAYHKVNNDTASDNSYRNSLKYEPNNAYVLNNFSYYLSLRTENLDEAENMSFKANQLEQNNSAFMDTYGWILYQKSDFEKAEFWIKKALENGGTESPVINEHYGDVLYRMGNLENATKYWLRSKELGNNTENIDKKIANKKLY